MNIRNITRLSLSPRPFEEGDKIPWDDPDFSRRMLNEHLSAGVERYLLVDETKAGIRMISASSQGYTESEYRELFHECGFGDAEIMSPNLGIAEAGFNFADRTIVAKK